MKLIETQHKTINFIFHVPVFHGAKSVAVSMCVSARPEVAAGLTDTDHVCVCCVYVCVCAQLPADFSRLHLADGLHPQVTHVSSSHSGCSITSDSGSSSLSDIYQVRPPLTGPGPPARPG